MKLINIGFGSMIAAGRVLAIVDPDSAPIKRVVQEARERGMLIDASYGRKTQAVILMDTDHVILSALTPDTLSARWTEKEEDKVWVRENCLSFPAPPASVRVRYSRPSCRSGRT